jgi:hypothetical protein
MIEISMHKRKDRVCTFGGWIKPILWWLVKTGIFIERLTEIISGIKTSNQKVQTPKIIVLKETT